MMMTDADGLNTKVGEGEEKVGMRTARGIGAQHLHD